MKVIENAKVPITKALVQIPPKKSIHLNNRKISNFAQLKRERLGSATEE